ncbi:MAG: cytochrome c oxidase subunit II [Pseudomonadota bacterium]
MVNLRSLSLLTLLSLPATLHAQELGELDVIGTPVERGINFQPAVTSLARDIHWLDNMLLVIITAIVLFVVALLAYVVMRFRAEANDTPARFTHNSTVEITWTVVPVLILIVIGSFSLPVLFKQLEVPEADLTIKTTGYQWYWSYEYPEEGIMFDAYMLGLNEPEMNDAVRDELAEYGYDETAWKLATDQAMVVPVNKIVRLQVTAGDVIHAWKIPAFGVHMDGIPGRLNETWFMAEQEGIYFGQCSELCGINHSYMPITVKVVSEEAYANWVVSQGGTVAGTVRETTVASAE